MKILTGNDVGCRYRPTLWNLDTLLFKDLFTFEVRQNCIPGFPLDLVKWMHAIRTKMTLQLNTTHYISSHKRKITDPHLIARLGKTLILIRIKAEDQNAGFVGLHQR